jgi:hypothetical protein
MDCRKIQIVKVDQIYYFGHGEYVPYFPLTSKYETSLMFLHVDQLLFSVIQTCVMVEKNQIVKRFVIRCVTTYNIEYPYPLYLPFKFLISFSLCLHCSHP